MIAINHSSLSRLSDSQLIKRLDALVEKERETTLEVLRHIIEFDRRKLYLGLGHSSLFDYCTLQLGYSASSAQRRIKTARCIIKFPEILGLLENNDLNLTGVCLLADILTPENKRELLKEACGKSKRRIEQIAARFKPGKDIPEKVKTVFVSALIDPPANSPDGENKTPGTPKSPDPSCVSYDSSQNNSGISTATGGSRILAGASGSRQQIPILKKKYKLEFAVEPQCMKKIEEAKAILSRKHPEGVPLGMLLEEALDAYLDKHSPERKKQRREKREAKKKEKKYWEQDKRSQQNKKEKTRMKNIETGKTEVRSSKNRGPTCCKHEEYNRHIPQAVQDEVFARDKGKCTFVGPDGTRCNSTWNLQIDHITPYAKGGRHIINNLRLLCARHNQYEAEKSYGKSFMEQRRCKSHYNIE
jgi:5-methylcytosine-specific restriction endonuclease McrA